MADRLDKSGLRYLWNRIGTKLSGKQDSLVSGTNIKTINNESILGEGNINISAGSESTLFAATYGETSYDEIMDAIRDNKLIIVSDDASYVVGKYSYSSSFIRLYTNQTYGRQVVYEYTIVGDHTWSRNPLLIIDAEMSDTSTKVVQNKVIKQYIDEKAPAIQTQDNWKYKIYEDGTFEAWYKATGQSLTINSASGNLYRSALTSLALPSNIYNNYTATIIHAEINCSHNNYPAWGMLASIYETGINYYAMSGGSRGASVNYTITSYMMGTLT